MQKLIKLKPLFNDNLGILGTHHANSLYMLRNTTFYMLSSFIVCLFLSPSISMATSMSCTSLLKASHKTATEIQILDKQKELGTKRKIEERSLHDKIGTLSPALENNLNLVFLGKDPDLTSIQKLIKSDPLASRLSEESKNKMLWLIKSKSARPYMAFLIGRYMNAFENNLDVPFNILQSIHKVVGSYTVERALLIAAKKISTNPNKDNIREVLEYVTGEKTYSINQIQYLPFRQSYSYHFFRDILLDIELELASVETTLL